MKKSLESFRTALAITSYHLDEEMANLTRACLASLKYGQPDNVFVIDDMSPYMARLDEVIQVWRPTNGGFPKCANTGFETMADMSDAEVFILSNNDIEFQPGWLEGILKPLASGYDISSINISDSDGYVLEDVIEPDGKFGSLWAMKRKVYETIGGFDENFGAGTHEDLDFWKRAKEAGFRIGKYRGAMVEHIGRATMDKLYPEREDYWKGREKYIEKYGRIDW